MTLDDSEILDIFKKHITYDKRTWECPDPQFTLRDFIGKTIDHHRRIRNPTEYDPNWESPNPEFYSVLEWTDGSILLFENYGDGECSKTNSYYYNGKKVLFSQSLCS